MKVGSRFYSKNLNKYGEIKRYCNNKFWWYMFDGETTLLEGSTAPKDLVWIETCCKCGKDCTEIYQINIIDEAGKTVSNKICSKQCAKEVIQETVNLLIEKSNDIMNQPIKKIN